MTELEWMKTFGQTLKNKLDDAWMTQRELAEESGISESSISYYINGERIPKIRSIINIAHALSCDPAELIDFGDIID